MLMPSIPMVRFGDGDSVPIIPWSFSSGGDGFSSYFELTALCIPLTLAYAFTVHKVQGLTLFGKVQIDLSRMWPCDHLLYVALSRVRSPEQLAVSGFQPRLVQADQRAVKFDDTLKPALDVHPEEKHKAAMWVTNGKHKKIPVKRAKKSLQARLTDEEDAPQKPSHKVVERQGNEPKPSATPEVTRPGEVGGIAQPPVVLKARDNSRDVSAQPKLRQVVRPIAAAAQPSPLVPEAKAAVKSVAPNRPGPKPSAPVQTAPPKGTPQKSVSPAPNAAMPLVRTGLNQNSQRAQSNHEAEKRTQPPQHPQQNPHGKTLRKSH